MLFLSLQQTLLRLPFFRATLWLFVAFQAKLSRDNYARAPSGLPNQGGCLFCKSVGTSLSLLHFGDGFDTLQPHKGKAVDVQGEHQPHGYNALKDT